MFLNDLVGSPGIAMASLCQRILIEIGCSDPHPHPNLQPPAIGYRLSFKLQALDFAASIALTHYSGASDR